MTGARVSIFFVATAAAVSVIGVGCYPCGGPCDDTVHPFPIRSASYQAHYQFAEFCPRAEADAGSVDDAGTELDAGFADDGGVPADAGSEAADAGIAPICDEVVSVDSATRIVTHTFTYRGQKHVVRYRATSVETLPKNRYRIEDSW